jgi:hypothetical protein
MLLYYKDQPVNDVSPCKLGLLCDLNETCNSLCVRSVEYLKMLNLVVPLLFTVFIIFVNNILAI